MFFKVSNCLLNIPSKHILCIYNNYKGIKVFFQVFCTKLLSDRDNNRLHRTADLWRALGLW